MGSGTGQLTFRPFLTTNPHEVFPLPQRALLTIFEYVLSDVKPINELHSLAQVSEFWRQLITSTSCLWRNFDVTDFDYKLSKQSILELWQAGLLNRVERIAAKGWDGSSSEDLLLKIVDSSSPTLREISLEACNITDRFLQVLMRSSGVLRSVDLTKSLMHYTNKRKNCKKGSKSKVCTIEASRVYDLLSATGKHLLELNLAENTFKPSTIVPKAVQEFCPNLTLLDLSNVNFKSESNVVFQVNILQSSCPRLKILRLANIELKTTADESPGFRDLEELSIPVSDFKWPEVVHTDAVIESLTKTAENLKLLDIRGSKNVSSVALAVIPAHDLRHIIISKCQRLFKEDLLKLLFSRWKHSLVEVDLSWNNNGSSVDGSLEALSTEENKSLSVVNLEGSSVSLPAVRKMVLNGKALQFIDLRACRGLPRDIKRTFSGEEVVKFKETMSDSK